MTADKPKTTFANKLTMFFVVMFFVGGGVLGLVYVIGAMAFGETKTPECSSAEAMELLEKILRGQSNDLQNSSLLFDLTATLAATDNVRECRTTLKATLPSKLQFEQGLKYQVMRTDDKKKFLVQVTVAEATKLVKAEPASTTNPTESKVVIPAAESQEPHPSSPATQFEVQVNSIGPCDGGSEGLCAATDKGMFSANAATLSRDEYQLLDAAAKAKASVCLKGVDASTSSNQTFETVAHKCD